MKLVLFHLDFEWDKTHACITHAPLPPISKPLGAPSGMFEKDSGVSGLFGVATTFITFFMVFRSDSSVCLSMFAYPMRHGYFKWAYNAWKACGQPIAVISPSAI